MLDLTDRTSNRLLLGIGNPGSAGSVVRANGIMLEEAVGVLNAPSVYSRGQSSQLAIGAIAAAAAAQDTADGKIDSFFQPNAPASGMALGDLWFDTDDGNKQYRYNGSTWVLAQDTAIGTAIANAAGAQATADSKVRTFYAASTAPPSASGVGDLWYVTDTGILNRWSGSAWLKVSDNSSNTANDYLINGSFDAGMDGWGADSGWYTEGGGAGGGLHVTKSGGAANGRVLNNKAFAIAKGEAFSVSALFINSGFVGTVRIGFLIFDASNNLLEVIENEIVGIGSTWVRKKTVAITQNAAAAYARATVVVYSHTAGFIYVDDVRVTKLASDTTENIVGVGKNLLNNADFGGLTGTPFPWVINAASAPGVMNLNYKRVGLDGGAGLTLDGDRGVVSCSNGYAANSSQYWEIYHQQLLEAAAGQQYEFGVYYANHRCDFYAYLTFYDASGSVTGYGGDLARVPPTYTGGKAISNYGRQMYFATAPANTVSMRMAIRRYQHGGSDTSSYSWFVMPFLGKATPNQQTFSDWAPGSTTYADQLGYGAQFGVVSQTDLIDSSGYNRLGLRVANSGHRLGSQRNAVRTQTSSYGSVRSTTALSASSVGAVSVNAHTVRYGSFSVSYNAVSPAVTGLTQGTTYVIYCYDGDYSGGTKTYYAGTNPDAVMQLGDDIIIIGQITIPTSGSSSGGGGSSGSSSSDWCVAVSSYLPDGTLAGELPVGHYLPCYNNRPNEPNIVHLVTQANDKADAECLRMSTVSGATIIASTTTPMTLRDGSCVLLPDMLGREALVYRLDGSFQWEVVVALDPVGVRRVAKISVSNQCYFAGETMDAFIATHNIQQIKP